MSESPEAELLAELKAARAALAEMEAKLARQADSEARVLALYDNLPDAVLSVEESGKIIGCNRSATLLLGTSGAQLVGSGLADHLEPESGAALVAICASDFEGAGESEVSLRDGTKVGFSLLRVKGGSVQLVLRNMTPMERLQLELLNTRRMASVGLLASGIAHEINNPLAVIQGRVEMLRAVKDMPGPTRDRHLDILEEHCRRVSRIVQNLHTFARPRIPEPRSLNLMSVVAAAQESLGLRMARVELEIKIESDLQVFADPDQLELVLVNLLSVAADTTPSGQRVRLFGNAAEGGGVLIRVEDEGAGLSDDLLAGLRAPYAPGTASVEAGRGLSMSISWGIVQEHGGWLTAENRLPKGSSVAFHLPGPASLIEDNTSGVVQGRSILIVDDDRMMCETISWMLTTDGHRIVSVHSAEEAIAQIKADHFDVVITDQRLPGMDGEALIAHIMDQWPELGERTVLTSGLLFRPARTHRYLQKPFSRAQLIKLLGELSD